MPEADGEGDGSEARSATAGPGMVPRRDGVSENPYAASPTRLNPTTMATMDRASAFFFMYRLPPRGTSTTSVTLPASAERGHRAPWMG
jgi:hypothetical protein